MAKKRMMKDILEMMFKGVKADISDVQKAKIYNNLWSGIEAALKSNGDRVVIHNFGSFSARKTKETKRRNPRTNEEIMVPPHIKVKFRCSPKLADRKKSS